MPKTPSYTWTYPTPVLRNLLRFLGLSPSVRRAGQKSKTVQRRDPEATRVASVSPPALNTALPLVTPIRASLLSPSDSACSVSSKQALYSSLLMDTDMQALLSSLPTKADLPSMVSEIKKSFLEEVEDIKQSGQTTQTDINSFQALTAQHTANLQSIEFSMAQHVCRHIWVKCNFVWRMLRATPEEITFI